MEIYDRIRVLRKQSLKMSQEEFGNALGVNRSVIKNIELNLLSRPEQKEPLYKLICKEFNVNYDWLVNGLGEMFVATKDSFVENLAVEYKLSDIATKVIQCYLELDKEQQKVVDDFVRSVSESIIEVETPAPHLTIIDDAIDKVSVWRAARSDSNTPPSEIEMSVERIKRLEEAPVTEEI